MVSAENVWVTVIAVKENAATLPQESKAPQASAPVHVHQDRVARTVVTTRFVVERASACLRNPKRPDSKSPKKETEKAPTHKHYERIVYVPSSNQTSDKMVFVWSLFVSTVCFFYAGVGFDALGQMFQVVGEQRG